MALLLPPLSSVPPPSSSLSFRSFACHLTLSLNLILQAVPFNGAGISSTSPFGERSLVIVHASSETGGKDGNEPEAAPPEGSRLEAASVENLPLESKLQMKLEQKLRMKLAKKIRLRRKRLLRKRKMRKKGRWPPSKMKKLKNV
ncbi:hypothetical protein Cni_G15525 [Canna indica]|uniref:50S ribosomal protein 5, chloroplastic n=1 Tax=Canna indica TaxID=4628 RepID=A0AAQ3KJQ5_9LILI|nr:hypothetical protein Cni_G15525 [Canna indica]